MFAADSMVPIHKRWRFHRRAVTMQGTGNNYYLGEDVFVMIRDFYEN